MIDIDDKKNNAVTESAAWMNFIVAKRWLENKNAKKSFAEYFQQCGYRTIGIYGAGDMGKLLYEEIKESDIQVKYFVDRNGEGIHDIDGIPVITVSHLDEMDEVDVVVVTFSTTYDTMCKMLSKYVPEIRTLSIRDAVFEM